MANSFNLSDYKNNAYLQTLYDPTKLYAAAEANMEETDVKQAENAVNSARFGSLTLSEKLNELGIGQRVVQQLGDTALGVVRDVIDPIAEYLEKYEHIFDEKAYNAALQSDAKQLFFSNYALSEEDSTNPVGRNFVYTM